MEKNMNKLIKELKDPPKEFTPVPFWFFNDKPDRETIKKQLEDFVSKGVHGFVLHPRIGLPKELHYLGEEYFSFIRYITETAAELEMSVVLYDEGMYPSGSAHGEVVKENPAFASRGITLTHSPGGRKLVACLPQGRYLIEDFTKGTIRGIHYGEDDKEEDAPLSADILNPQAVEAFIRLTHERYYEKLGEYFGSTIIGFFTDEPCIMGRNVNGFFAWTEGLAEEITARGGTLQDLAALFDNKENNTTELYKRLVKERLNQVFYKRISEWCTAHRISLMGHPARSDDIEEEMYFHIPGQDLIMRRVAPETGGVLEPDSVQAKCSADMACHLGRRRNSNECFGVCCRDKIPWYFTAADMKWYIDWLGVRGVNLYIPHAFYYSIAGKRKEERPPDVGPNNIWWDHYKLFSDYMKRISCLMTDSGNCARVAVLCESGHMPYKETACLYEKQIEFHYLPVSLLERCTVTDGRLQLNGWEYSSVLEVTGRDYGKVLKSVPVITDCTDLKPHDFVTDIPCPGLRVKHLIKDGISLYFIFNEGREEIHTAVTVQERGVPVILNLWNFSLDQAESWEEKRGTRFFVHLNRGETRLILFDGEGEYKASKRTPAFLGNFSGRFQLVSCEPNRKTYEMIYEADYVEGDEIFEVSGEEMAECYCNGQFAGVGFFHRHRFSVGGLLKKGKNELRLIFTGNAANLYAGGRIPYGIER